MHSVSTKSAVHSLYHTYVVGELSDENRKTKLVVVVGDVLLELLKTDVVPVNSLVINLNSGKGQNMPSVTI